MCEDIQYYAAHKLKPDDDAEFRKLFNRIKDDEDLDSIAQKKLQDLYKKYLGK